MLDASLAIVIVRWHRCQVISPIANCNWFTIQLSVCHVCALCFKWKRYWHDFFCIGQSQVAPRCVKIWLTSVNLFLPKLCPKVTHPLLIWGSMTFDGKLRLDGHWSQWRAYRKSPLLYCFQMVPSLTPTTSPKMGVLRCRLLPSYFGPCLFV